MSSQKPFIVSAKEIAENQFSFSHPKNPNSLITGTQLGKLTGLKRTGVNLAKIPPGKESFIYHSHYCEED